MKQWNLHKALKMVEQKLIGLIIYHIVSAPTLPPTSMMYFAESLHDSIQETDS